MQAAPQEHGDHCRQRGVQRRNGCDQIDTGLPRVDQDPGGLHMQRAPAARRDPLNEFVGAGLTHLHRAEQATIADADGTAEHARGTRRAPRDVGGGAAGSRPGWRRRQEDVNDQRAEGQRHEPPHERLPILPATQPQQPGHHVRHDKKRHVDAADDHLPPGRLWHLDALLQPHRRDVPEEQPAVRLRLRLPQGGRADQSGRMPAHVVQQ